jgi:hypothetical protein
MACRRHGGYGRQAGQNHKLGGEALAAREHMDRKNWNIPSGLELEQKQTEVRKEGME